MRQFFQILEADSGSATRVTRISHHFHNKRTAVVYFSPWRQQFAAVMSKIVEDSIVSVKSINVRKGKKIRKTGWVRDYKLSIQIYQHGE